LKNQVILQNVKKITKERCLEIDITYQCNLSCIQCNRCLGKYPSKDYIPLKQISNIFLNLLLLEQPFTKIHILGGEPTLHPDLFKVLQVINSYREKIKNTEIKLWSNGQGEKINQTLCLLPNWVEVKITPKSNPFGNNNFEAFLAAPIDYKHLHIGDYENGCSNIQANKCGVGVNKNGFYVCPVAGAIDYVKKFGLGINNLKNLNNETFKKQCSQLCMYCGHFLVDKEIFLPINTISKSWKEEGKTNE
jgi:wyosine [tRNA(Phe)-imidazoG37] synthetase (radical SAM superfamily)